MKRVISGVLQFILFLVVFVLGSLLPSAHLSFLPLPMLTVSTSPGRVFVYDGVLLAFMVYGLILLIASARKRIRMAWLTSTIALVLALILGWATGFKSVG